MQQPRNSNFLHQVRIGCNTKTTHWSCSTWIIELYYPLVTSTEFLQHAITRFFEVITSQVPNTETSRGKLPVSWYLIYRTTKEHRSRRENNVNVLLEDKVKARVVESSHSRKGVTILRLMPWPDKKRFRTAASPDRSGVDLVINLHERPNLSSVRHMDLPSTSLVAPAWDMFSSSWSLAGYTISSGEASTQVPSFWTSSKTSVNHGNQIKFQIYTFF